MSRSVRDEPAIQQLLSRMPSDISSGFSEEQLTHLFAAVGTRSWGRHTVDLRGVFSIPFYKRRFYFVVLFGKNHRELSRIEHQLSSLSFAFIVSLFVLFSIMLGLLILYLIKSALGINIFEHFSFGIWGWFKSLFS